MLNAKIPEDIKDIEILEADENKPRAMTTCRQSQACRQGAVAEGNSNLYKKNSKIKKEQGETSPSYGLLLIGTEIKLLILK
jgi:hypothetical protein